MVYRFYDLLLALVALVLIPFYFLRGLRGGKTRQGMRERLGVYAPGRLSPIAGRPVIWIHAVSVGETRAAVPLIKALRSRFPSHALVLTNVTETGRQIAAEIPELDLCLYFPFDFSRVMRSVLRRIDPVLAIIVETEIWPNFIRELHRRKTPVILVNGRISDRSFPRYLKVRPLLEPVLRQVSTFCMQSRQDADRIARMGAPPSSIRVTGNLKFDMQAERFSPQQVEDLRTEYGLAGDLPVWVAGSTHAGEEELLLQGYRELLEQGEKCVLVLVPRHPERCRVVADTMTEMQIPFRRRSELPPQPPRMACGEVLLVDTLGEMMALYALADLVFVGGSLVAVGGHNILEPALMGKPVLFGPYMNNFREISRLIREEGAGVCVEDLPRLIAEVEALLTASDDAKAMGERGATLVSKHSGATERTLEELVSRMEGR